MGREELAAALREKAVEEKNAIWRRAEAAAAEAEAAAVAEAERMEAARQANLRQQEQGLQRALDRRVEQRLLRARLRAQARLAQRLETLGRQLLGDWPPADRHAAWASRAAELPECDWATIRVHPDDLRAAEEQFPGRRIESDAALGGGLVVATAGETLVIDNSFEGRRQRLWPQLLGAMLAGLEAQLEDDA